ncbi:MAG: glycosyltransferase family 39 protein [Culturomica sp.]|jgi:4-amino-4-deoxy-L-arabinose transferase-like glycosyltransferase|nr:glycosyltransferase family 39 protein [Culturomica sp.]
MFENRASHLIILAVAGFFAFFVHNGLIYPDIMESRNLITAREMVAYDNWLVPTMNGELRLEKPPLPTWIAAGLEQISPDHLVLQRAAAGVAALFLLLFLYLLGELLTGKRLYALIASLVFCTSVNAILTGRTATWDIYCHAFMLAAIYCLFRGVIRPGKNWGLFSLSGLLMGLSFLGKGPVSFYALLLPFLLVWGILYRPSLKGKAYPLLAAVGICLAVSVWWPVYLYVYHREAALAVWNKESAAWLSHNVRPWYYYWKFFVESGCWSLLLLTALYWPYWKKRLAFRKEYLFCVAWTLAVLAFLSFVPEKKNRYLFPVLIPAALTVAHVLHHWMVCFRGRRLPAGPDRWLYKINTWLLAVISLALPVGVYLFFYREGDRTLGQFLPAGALLSGVAGVLLYAAFRNRPALFLSGVVLLHIASLGLLLPDIGSVFMNRERESIHRIRAVPETAGVPFYYPEEEGLRIELVYEAGRRIRPWDIRGEAFPEQLPIVLVSGKKAAELLPPSLLEQADLREIGRYDDNWRPKTNRRYSQDFIKYVTLLYPRQQGHIPAKSEP